MKNVRLNECDNNGMVLSDGYSYIVSVEDFIKLRNESEDGFVCLCNGWFKPNCINDEDVMEYARVDKPYIFITSAPEGIYAVDEFEKWQGYPEPLYSEFEELWDKVEAGTKVKVED